MPSTDRYSAPAIGAHWIIALLILVAWPLGVYMHELPLSPYKLKLYSYHKWIGITVLLLAVQTGLRVSELTGLRCKDIDLGRGAHVRCRGKGRVTFARRISVTIPPGIDETATLRLSGQGEAGPAGGQPGNLFVKVRIKPHQYFARQGKTIQLQVGVNIAQAILGDEIELETVDGAVAFKLPAATQSGQQFRLKGKGMSVLRSQARGDMYVELQVETPVNLTKKQKELLRQFDAAATEANQPETHGFFARVKEFWGGAKT